MFSWFKKKETKQVDKNLTTVVVKGQEAYLKGAKLFYEDQSDEEALPYLDISIESGVKEALAVRAWCLQGLKYYSEALVDFTDAIKYEPTVANHYFGRGLCYVFLCRHEYGIPDFEKAVQLSEIKNELNYMIDLKKQEEGWGNSKHFYETQLNIYKDQVEMLKASPHLMEAMLKNRKILFRKN